MSQISCEFEAHDDLDDLPDAINPGNKASSYRLKDVLKLPRSTAYTTQAIYEQIIGNDINLQPEYQRDFVWPESKQVSLIDSILRNFYIPPVIFVSHQHEDGSETKTCIDGKQRLASIRRFMDGQIPHKDPQSGDKYWYKSNIANKTGGSQGYILPERYRRLFANKQIVCIEYQDLAGSEEREIFQRVQLGMALAPAEKLQVLNSPMAGFVRQLQLEYFGEDKPLSGSALDWDRSRGGDFRCIAHVLYSIAKYPSITSLGTVAQLEKWLHDPTRTVSRAKNNNKANDDNEENLAEDQLFLSHIHDTLRVLSHLVSDRNLRALSLQSRWRISPVEFIVTCLLISVEKDKVNMRTLAEKIGRMREVVREEHVDIRMNVHVVKTLLDFVKGSEARGARTSVAKRKLEDAPPESGQPKVQKQGGLSLAASTPPPPPRLSAIPDRVAALRDANKSVSEPSSPRLPPTAPAALRNASIGRGR